jgi:hypothetical protein
MRSVFRSAIAATSLILAAPVGVAFAQPAPAPKAAPAAPPAAAPSPQQQEMAPMKQVELSEKQIQSLLAAQKDMDAITEKMPENSDKPDPKLQGQLEGVAKKHGFASYAEYADVVANVSLVLSGIDPKTKAFSEPPVVLKKQIAEVTADSKMSAKDKQDALADMNEALKYTPNVQYPGNVTLVTKYYDKLSAIMMDDE